MQVKFCHLIYALNQHWYILMTIIPLGLICMQDASVFSTWPIVQVLYTTPLGALLNHSLGYYFYADDIQIYISFDSLSRFPLLVLYIHSLCAVMNGS